MANEKILKSIEERLARLEAGMVARRSPVLGPQVDPAPWGPMPPIVDPGPWGPYPYPYPRPYPRPYPDPNPVDPSPIDFSRLTRVQLDTILHSINAEKIRLDALENQIKDEIKKIS